MHELGGDPGIAGSDAVDALDQRGPGDVAKDHAAKTLLQVGAGGFVVLSDHNAAASHGLKQHAQAG